MGLSGQDIEAIANAASGVIEQLLYRLYLRFEHPEEEGSLVHNAKQF